LQTWEVNRVAIGECAKALREALRALGKRASLRWIYYQCQPPADVTRLDPYGLFWRWFRALWKARREGAELLFEDFCARVAALREGSEAPDTDCTSQILRCESEHSDVIRAVLRGEDPAHIRKEVLESIAANRRLLAALSMLEARREAA